MRKLKLPGRDSSRPRLDEHDIELIKELGIDKVKENAERIVREKLEEPDNLEESSVPSAGNPVYKAMHACNCTSRKELFQAHRFRPDKELTESKIESITDLLTRWIVREYNFYQEEQRQQQKSLGEFS